MRRPRVALIADDLTGAADACVAFVARGLSGAVCFDDAAGAAPPAADAGTAGPRAAVTGDAWAAAAEADVVAFSTDTRAETASVAEARVREAVARGLAASSVVEPGAHRLRDGSPGETTDGRPVWLFKKIDSTLRGHTGVEIRAALEASRATLAIVTPAFPALGRVVEHGTLRVTGRGAPPPIDVRARLALPEARRVPRGALPAALRTALASGDRFLICDALDPHDLDAIVDAGLAFGGERVLWTGSAGLARALAERITGIGSADGTGADAGAGVTASRAAARGGERLSGSILLAIGSNHPATVAQVEQLRRGDERGSSGQRGERGERSEAPIACADVSDAAAIDARLSQGDDLIVQLPPSAAEADVARFAATIVERSRERAAAPVAGLIMSGGDTAARLCRHMQATRIDLGGEVSPGIPWGLLSVRSGGRWPLVLKSGGFGADDALSAARAFLRAGAWNAARRGPR